MADANDVKARREELRREGKSPADALRQAVSEAGRRNDQIANETYRRNQ